MNRWKSLAICILIGLLFIGTALLFSPVSRDTFLLPKAVFSEILLLALVFLWALNRNWSFWERLDNPFTALERTPLDLPILAILFTAFLSVIMSDYPKHDGFSTLKTLTLYVLAYYLLVEWFLGTRSQRWLLDLGLGTAVVIAVYSLLQDHGIDFFDFAGGVQDWRGRLSGTLGSSDFIGDYLALWTPYAVLCAYCGSAARRVVCLFFLFLMGASLTVTFCMGALTALTVVFVVATLGYLVGFLRGRAPRIFLGRVLPIVFCLLVSVSYYLVPNGISPHSKGLLNEAKSSGRWTSGMAARFFIWKTTALMVRDHPWVGVGFGEYGQAHPRYQGKLYKIRNTPHDRSTVGIVPQVHLEYYQWVAETGIFGFVALAWLLIAFFRGVYRARSALQGEDDEARFLWRASYAGIGVFLVHSCLTFPFQLPANRLVGLLMASIAIAPAALKAISVPTDGAARTRGFSLPVLVAFVVLLLFGVIQIARPFVADILRTKALALTPELRLKELDRALSWDMESPEGWLMYGGALQAQGNMSSAANAWEESARLEDGLAIHEMLFDAYAKMGLGGELLKQAEAIADINPCYPPNQVRLGDTYALMGQDAKALKAYDQAIYLDPSLKDSLDGNRRKVMARIQQAGK